MKATFKVGGNCFKRAVDDVLKDKVTYSNVVDVKVATVFSKADQQSSIVLVESGVFEHNMIDKLIATELDKIDEERVTVFFCCCLSNGTWSAVNTCTSKRVPATNTFRNQNIGVNPSYTTYLMEGLLNLTNIPEQIDSRLMEVLVDIKGLLAENQSHVDSVYRSYVDAASKTKYLSSLFADKKPTEPTNLPIEGLAGRRLNVVNAKNKQARDKYNSEVSTFNKARLDLEKNLRMQHTLRCMKGLLAFVYYPWKDSVDGINRCALKSKLKQNKAFESKLAKLLKDLSKELSGKKLQQNQNYLVKCMHCAEDNFLHTVTDRQVRQILAAEEVVMFSILKAGGDENSEQRISPPCALCLSHFRSEIIATFRCNDYATYHVADVGDGTPEVLVRQPKVSNITYELRNEKFVLKKQKPIIQLRY